MQLYCAAEALWIVQQATMAQQSKSKEAEQMGACTVIITGGCQAMGGLSMVAIVIGVEVSNAVIVIQAYEHQLLARCKARIHTC